jgi:hypothetical protein
MPEGSANTRLDVSQRAAVRGLRRYLRRSGYMRVPDMARRQQEKSLYKKGFELRFIVYSLRELAEVRRLLRRIDLVPGRPYLKHSQAVLPLYGARQVQHLLPLVRGRCRDPDSISTRPGRRRRPRHDMQTTKKLRTQSISRLLAHFSARPRPSGPL